MVEIYVKKVVEDEKNYRVKYLVEKRLEGPHGHHYMIYGFL